jgi:hypothetical protein
MRLLLPIASFSGKALAAQSLARLKVMSERPIGHPLIVPPFALSRILPQLYERAIMALLNFG